LDHQRVGHDQVEQLPVGPTDGEHVGLANDHLLRRDVERDGLGCEVLGGKVVERGHLDREDVGCLDVELSGEVRISW